MPIGEVAAVHSRTCGTMAIEVNHLYLTVQSR